MKRDKEAAIIAGVVAGLANYFRKDPALFRLITIVLLILTGVFPILLIYLAAWVVMPKADDVEFDYEVE